MALSGFCCIPLRLYGERHCERRVAVLAYSNAHLSTWRYGATFSVQLGKLGKGQFESHFHLLTHAEANALPVGQGTHRRKLAWHMNVAVELDDRFSGPLPALRTLAVTWNGSFA